MIASLALIVAKQPAQFLLKKISAELDIERAAKALKIKPGEFAKKYLKIDEDKDYVLKTTPCPFLDENNYCGLYDDRPKACREYPHTNRKRVVQIMDLTYENSQVCPAVLEMLSRLRKTLK